LHMKQSETENLLALIFQSGGQVMVEDNQLLVGPPSIAGRFGDQIRKLKPEILLSLGHCPVCAGSLTVEVRVIESATENSMAGRTGRHVYCIAPRHLDKWEF